MGPPRPRRPVPRSPPRVRRIAAATAQIAAWQKQRSRWQPSGLARPVPRCRGLGRSRGARLFSPACSGAGMAAAPWASASWRRLMAPGGGPAPASRSIPAFPASRAASRPRMDRGGQAGESPATRDARPTPDGRAPQHPEKLPFMFYATPVGRCRASASGSQSRTRAPRETDARLVVDPDGVLARPVSGQSFQPVARGLRWSSSRWAAPGMAILLIADLGRSAGNPFPARPSRIGPISFPVVL